MSVFEEKDKSPVIRANATVIDSVITLSGIEKLVDDSVVVFTLPSTIDGTAINISVNEKKYRLMNTNNECVNDLLGGVCHSLTYSGGYFYVESRSLSTLKISLSNTDWSSNKASISVKGIKASDEPIIGLDLSGISDVNTKKQYKEEWSKVIDAQTRDDYIDFYCSEVPTISLSLIVKGV